MIPKFKVGEKFTRITNPQYFHIVKTIIIKADGIYYINEAYPEESFSENEIAKYTEPKPKVKKYLYAYRFGNNPISVSGYFYENDFEFKNDPHGQITWYQRLDWSMIEVDV